MTTETIHLAVYDMLADWEFGFATAHLNMPQFQKAPGRFRVTTVGETADPVTSTGGMRILPDITLDQLDPERSAMLILPGGSSWMDGDRNLAYAKKAREFADAGVPVAAICGAAIGLAAAGLLDDRAHTGNSPDELAATGYQGGNRYQDEPAVTDRGVITAGGIAPVEFTREIFALLDAYEPAVLDAWFLMFRHHDMSGVMALAGPE
ncbi:MAG: DJ-1/PfpI family protein [Micromonosporaceae bacterium]